VRFYWAIVGNEFSRQLLFPRIFRKVFWKEFWHEVKWYGFMTRKCGKFVAHNPLAQIAMFLFNVVVALFMVITGFALYSQGTGAGSWADKLFGWVFVIEPSSQTVKMWHLFGMWLMLFFVVLHIYMAIREDVHSRQNGVGTMISGWRRFRDDGPMSPQ
jgi:Ni/Fe-hydrogenase 1 B-type cytochrome subunit